MWIVRSAKAGIALPALLVVALAAAPATASARLNSAPARDAAASRPVVIIPSDSGGACVIFVTHDAHPVSCDAPGTRGYAIVGLPPGKGNEDMLAVTDVGDVNGDGLDDFALGVPWAEFDGRKRAGITYVVFGSEGREAVDLQSLGARGFRIGGAAADDETATLEENQLVDGRGDVNGDGLDDILVQSSGASTPVRHNGGAIYVVFGKADDTDVDLAALGSGGYRIDGAEDLPTASIVGDFNGDGKADIVAENNPAEIFLGKSSSSEESLEGRDSETRIGGMLPVNGTESSVTGVGDVNGDGIDDLLVGRYDLFKHRAYIVYGRRRPATINVTRLGVGGASIEARYPGLNGFGEGAGLGRLSATGEPLVAVTDPKHVYVLKLPRHSRRLDLRAPGLPGFTVINPHRERQGPEPPLVMGLGAPDSSAAAGDMLVEWSVKPLGRLEKFIVFGRRSPGTINLRHLAGNGFEISHTA